MVDAHTWWRMGDRSYGPEISARMAADLAEFDITWLEEPLPPDDHEAYAKLKASASVPIASGEHEPSDDGFLDLIAQECVDYVQTDLVCQGGYATGKKVLAEVQAQDLKFAFHSWGTDLEVLAGLVGPRQFCLGAASCWDVSRCITTSRADPAFRKRG